MNTDERAEKILKHLHGSCNCTKAMHDADIDFIVHEIGDVARETREDQIVMCEPHVKQAHSDGRALALEEQKMQCVAHARESYCPVCEDGFKRGLEEAANLVQGVADESDWGDWRSGKKLLNNIAKRIRTLKP